MGIEICFPTLNFLETYILGWTLLGLLIHKTFAFYIKWLYDVKKAYLKQTEPGHKEAIYCGWDKWDQLDQ